MPPILSLPTKLRSHRNLPTHLRTHPSSFPNSQINSMPKSHTALPISLPVRQPLRPNNSKYNKPKNPHPLQTLPLEAPFSLTCRLITLLMENSGRQSVTQDIWDRSAHSYKMAHFDCKEITFENEFELIVYLTQKMKSNRAKGLED